MNALLRYYQSKKTDIRLSILTWKPLVNFLLSGSKDDAVFEFRKAKILEVFNEKIEVTQQKIKKTNKRIASLNEKIDSFLLKLCNLSGMIYKITSDGDCKTREVFYSDGSLLMCWIEHSCNGTIVFEMTTPDGRKIKVK
jgi:hypothetical protein